LISNAQDDLLGQQDYGLWTTRKTYKAQKNKSFYICFFSIINAHYEGYHATQYKYTQLDTSDTSSHKLVFIHVVRSHI